MRKEEKKKRGEEEKRKRRNVEKILQSPYPNGAPAHKSVETLRIIEVPSLDRLPYNASEVCELVHG